MRIALVALTLVGFAVGIWHAWLAIQAILVFRTGEPATSWIAIVCGPLSTLPAVLLSCFRRRPAGYWLVAAAVTSFLAFLVGEGGVTENVLPFLRMMAIPMLAIGVTMLLLSRTTRRAVPA